MIPRQRPPAVIDWGRLERGLRGQPASALGQVAVARLLGPATVSEAAAFVLRHRPGGLLAERALVLLDSPIAVAVFLAAFQRARDAQSRVDALFALMRVADGSVVPWLPRFWAHSEHEVQVIGACILRELTYSRRISRTSAARAVELARSHTNREVRALGAEVDVITGRLTLPARDLVFPPQHGRSARPKIEIDWEALARGLGTVRGDPGDFAESGAGEEREALALILGTENVIRAVDVVLQRRRGFNAARAVLALLRPEAARTTTRNATRLANSPAERRRADALLELLSDASRRRRLGHRPAHRVEIRKRPK